MNFVRIDPPGTFCNNEALRDLIKDRDVRTFVDVGCGGGQMSKLLCSLGLTGVGVDFSRDALRIAESNLAEEIAAGAYRLVEGDATELDQELPKQDMALSYMVMEHVEDDVDFARRLLRLVKPGGLLVLAVPGRRDHWSFEDETVGHLRRYDREDLERVLVAGGLEDVRVWSVAVPVANILFRIGDALVKNSDEAKKIGQSQRQQTETSGIRDIPWKTVFPAWVKLILNRVTLYPLFVLQRMFYNTGYGVTMIGFGKAPGVNT